MHALVNRWRASSIDSPGSNEPPEPCADEVDSAEDGDDGDEHAPNMRKAVHNRVVRIWLVLRLIWGRLRTTPTYDTDRDIMTNDVIDPAVPDSIVSLAINGSIDPHRLVTLAVQK